MQAPQRSWALPLILLGGSNLTTASQSPDTRLTPVATTDLCVTEGEIGNLPGQRLSVTVPKMLAYVNANTSAVAEARFTYLGPTGNESPLASGEMCNLA